MDNCLFLKGKLKFMILQILSKDPLHAYGIRKKISELSSNLFNPSFGSLYPALDDLLENKYLKVKEKQNKKVYQITELGKKHLLELKKDFKTMEKHIIKSFKTGYNLDTNPEEMMKIFLSHHKISAKITYDYLEDIIKFMNNYNKGKITKNDLKNYEDSLKNSFETLKEINKKYRD
jgi:DNA-binding PadR family transcriptional regulator